MDLKSMFPDTTNTTDVVVSLATAGIAYLVAQKMLKSKKLYSQKPYHAAGAALSGLVGGHLAFVEYQKHEQATKVAGYLG